MSVKFNGMHQSQIKLQDFSAYFWNTPRKLCLFSHRTQWNTCLAQSVSRPCKSMQFLFNSLMFTTLLTTKHDQVALLIDSAFTWSS